MEKFFLVLLVIVIGFGIIGAVEDFSEAEKKKAAQVIAQPKQSSPEKILSKPVNPQTQIDRSERSSSEWEIVESVAYNLTTKNSNAYCISIGQQLAQYASVAKFQNSSTTESLLVQANTLLNTADKFNCSY